MIALYKPFNGSSYMQPIRVTRDQWNRLIANPMVLNDKKKAPLMIFGSMAEYVELDNESGKPRCTGANIDELYALQVDVDNGTTMEAFERDFHRYSYQLWTTYSWHNGKEGDRYRAVFPLKEPIKVRWLVKPVKDILINLFDMADQSCFDRGHWQCLPCVGGRDKPYRYVQHQGEYLSFSHENFGKMAEEYENDMKAYLQKLHDDRDPGEDKSWMLRHTQNVFDKTVEGERDKTVYSKLSWLRDEGFSYNDVMSLRPPYGFEMDYVKKVNYVFSKGRR